MCSGSGTCKFRLGFKCDLKPEFIDWGYGNFWSARELNLAGRCCSLGETNFIAVLLCYSLRFAAGYCSEGSWAGGLDILIWNPTPMIDPRSCFCDVAPLGTISGRYGVTCFPSVFWRSSTAPLPISFCGDWKNDCDPDCFKQDSAYSENPFECAYRCTS